MKVKIKHEEIEHGLIFKKTFPKCTLSVKFTEEEKEALQGLDPENLVFQEHIDARTGNNIFQTLGEVIRYGGCSFVCANVAEAKAVEATYIDSLKMLKEFIEQNTAPVSNKSFEL